MRQLRSALLLDQARDAADLEGATNLVKGIAVIAHDLAGLRHVAELLGQLQQRQFLLVLCVNVAIWVLQIDGGSDFQSIRRPGVAGRSTLYPLDSAFPAG